MLVSINCTVRYRFIYSLCINKQLNCILIGWCQVKALSRLHYSQSGSEWSVFRRDHLHPLWVPQRITAVIQVKRVSKKLNLDFNSWNSFLTLSGTESSEGCSSFSVFSFRSPITFSPHHASVDDSDLIWMHLCHNVISALDSAGHHVCWNITDRMIRAHFRPAVE